MVKFNLSLTLIIVGLLIIFATHLEILRSGLPQALENAHAIFLISAGVIIAIAYATKK